MFDKLYFGYIKKDHPKPDHIFKPNKSIVEKLYLNPKSDKLVVIFPHWHGWGRLYNILAGRLVKQGWSVLVYHIHDQVLSDDDRLVNESFDYIIHKVPRDIEKLQKEHNYKKVHLLGLSLGNVPMLMMTSVWQAFDGATLVVPGDNLAEDMWHSPVTQWIKHRLQKNHIGIRKLRRKWNKEDLSKYAINFTDKPVDLFVSKSDRVILPEYQKKVIEMMDRSKAVTNVKRLRLGHALSIVKFCLTVELK